jgi:pimeloyl-ACP methyl ester carboxylesterase
MFYGISTSYMKDMVDYWISEFNWRKVEADINAFKQYRVDVRGIPIHFIFERGKGPNPTPLLLTHGWPWTFWDWSKVIRPLTDPAAFGGDPKDAFDVIVPSLPGFGFSTPLPAGDMNFWKMGDLFHILMTDVLGYTKYGAGGADYGALITTHLGHKYAKYLHGIHLGHDLVPIFLQNDRNWDVTVGITPEDASSDLKAAIKRFEQTYVSHVAVHMLDAQTLTLGLNDSAVGMLAWLLQRWRKWSDPNANFASVFPNEHVLTNATIYWVTQSIGSSIRAYSNIKRYPWQPSHDRKPLIEAPAGFTFLTGDAYPPGATPENRVDIFRGGPTAEWFNTVYAKAHGVGGHFVPWENPSAFIEDVRNTFRIVGATSTS